MTPERYARVKDIFHEVNERPLLERNRFLDEACDGDVELRREVESLLEHDSNHTLIAVPKSSPVEQRASATGHSKFDTARTFAGNTTRTLRVLTVGVGAKGQVVLGVVLTTLVLSVLGWWMHAGIRYSLKELRRTQLQTHLDADVTTLTNWFGYEVERFKIVRVDIALQRLLAELNERKLNAKTELSPTEHDRLQTATAEIRKRFTLLIGKTPTFTLWNPQLRVVMDSERASLRGERVSEEGGAVLAKALRGESLIRLPHIKDVTLSGDSVELPQPVMTLVLPILDDAGEVLGIFVLRELGLENRFFEILKQVRPGSTGETYAFDKHGTLLSESRFNDTLRRLKLIPESADSHSSLVLQIRDPGGDLTAGFALKETRSTRPLTRMAQFATAEQDGIDLEGYRDYRGVSVIGAWTWLPQLGFGVTTEIDCAEAFAPLRYVDVTFGVMVVVLLTSIGAILWWLLSLLRRHREVGEQLQVGQYTLVRPIGEGGMGAVYLAKHALLKRPTAVKLLRPDKSSQQAIAWFDREVQLVSQLSHPNTIEIYDYGHTLDGIFYFAMEYLPGLTLAQLVARGGPLPPARVIFLLRQICGSLREAHAMQLVHRDIKPQNIMVCDRAGEYDVIKVLDFGLVKGAADENQTPITQTGILAGTPLYIAPERIRNPDINDPRIDIYALGAVAFFLLTGRDVFQSQTEADLFYQVMNLPAPLPSAIATTPIPRELDQLVVDCLAKDPAARPQSMTEMQIVLSAIQCESRWGQTDAFRWWQTHAGRLPHEPAAQPPAAVKPQVR